MKVATIRAQSLSKQYPGARGVVALSEITVDIPAGRFVSILGPSGCGKSTFLRCVAGLEDITAGELLVNEAEVHSPPHGIGMVFQRDALLEWRTIRKNIVLPVEFAKKRPVDYAEKVDYLLDLVGLSDFGRCYPRELSGGMRQRAAICRALVDDPGLLLMDEPFGALDAFTRDQMNFELQRIWMETKNTVLFVTHGISEAVYLADVVMVLSPRPGRLMETITVDLPRPRPLAVRETLDFGHYTSHIRGLFDQMSVTG
ncbi:MAG: ABC transporter ATP-binding protein [Burkholderiaceae bacterium]|nr:MAG: ABC transporter ATP-binding protein [Burkholderiaceae bacterium]